MPKAIVSTPDKAVSGMFCGGNPLCAGTQVMARRFDSLKLDGIPAGNTMGGSVKSTKPRVFSSQAVALIVVNREAAMTLFAEAGVHNFIQSVAQGLAIRIAALQAILESIVLLRLLSVGIVNRVSDSEEVFALLIKNLIGLGEGTIAGRIKNDLINSHQRTVPD